jgi:secretory phospholipase A2
MKIDTEYLPAPEMAKCCDAHDICYDTCNSDKDLCDLDFKRCLYKYCDSFEKSSAGDLLIKGCKAAAKMLFTGTTTLGCKAYLDAQARACFCGVNQGGQGGQQKYDKFEYKQKQKEKKYGWKNEM